MNDPNYALAVSMLFTKATSQTIMLGTPPCHVLSTSILYSCLLHDKRFRQVPMSDAAPGDIVIASHPNQADGYAGIVVDHGRIVSDSSQGVRNNSSLVELQRSRPAMATFRYIGIQGHRSLSLANAGFDPDEPRMPAGQPGGGQWTTDNPFANPLKLTLAGLTEAGDPIRNNVKGHTAGMEVNLDGGTMPGGKAVYGPNNTGYELTQNAGWWAGEKLSKGIIKNYPSAVWPGTNIAKKTNWFGVVTDKNGSPIVQGPNDPNPGSYITQTKLEDKTRPVSDPRRYFNSFVSNGIVSPDPKEVGLIATVIDSETGAYQHCIIYDKGPAYGEASLNTAQFFGVATKNADNRWASTAGDGRFVYFVYPGSRQNPPWPLSNQQINAIGNQYMNGNPNVQKAIDAGLDYSRNHPRK